MNVCVGCVLEVLKEKSDLVCREALMNDWWIHIIVVGLERGRML